MTRTSMLRRAAGTVLLIVSLGLTNCQAVVGTLVADVSVAAFTLESSARA